MKINKIASLILVLFLAGCSSVVVPTAMPTQPEPTSTLTPLPTNTSKPIETFTPSPPVSTPIIAAKTTVINLTKVSQTKQTLLKGFQGTALSLAWSSDGKFLFIGTGQSGLIIYDLEKNKILANPFNGLRIQALALSPDEKTLAIGIANDHSIRIIDSKTGDILNSLSTHGPPAVSTFSVLAFSPNGEVLASGTSDEGVFLWDTATGKEIKHFFPTDDYSIGGMSFSPDGKSLIASFEFSSKVWDTTTWELRNRFLYGFANDLAFSPDGSKFAVALSASHEASILDFTSGYSLFDLSGFQGEVWAIAYSPNGKYVAAGGIGNAVVVWDANTGNRAYKLVTGPNFIQSLTYSPDGTKLACGGSEVIIIWDMQP